MILRKIRFFAICSIILSFLFTLPILAAEPAQRSILRVDKLSCGSCLSQINTKLQTFSGYLGMGVDLRRGLVAVDHRASLESTTISKAITSLGYPARVVSESTIDKNKSSLTSGNSQNFGCCSTAPALPSAQNLSSNSSASSEETDPSGRYGSIDVNSGSSSGCCTVSSTWRKLINRFIGKEE